MSSPVKTEAVGNAPFVDSRQSSKSSPRLSQDSPKCWNLNCQNEATKKCSRCHSAMYCGPTCQKADWKSRHKIVCRSPELIKPKPSVDDSSLKIESEEKTAVDGQEIVLMEKSISDNVKKAMGQFLNTHVEGKGIWYPNEYKEYLKKKNSKMDESCFTGFANEKFFKKVGLFAFTLKEGVKASDALLSFLEGPTVADCGNATVACQYKCILDIIGKEKFDKLFSTSPTALRIDPQGIMSLSSPIFIFSTFTEAFARSRSEGVFGKRPLKIGEECHFSGIRWYGNKHPAGVGSGWNVIYIGDNEAGNQLFMAHGFEKPLTEDEINQKLIEVYNQERTPQDEYYMTQAKKPKVYDKETNVDLKSHYTVSQEEVEKDRKKFIKGFIVGSVRGFQADKLVRLKNTTDIDKCMRQLSEGLQRQYVEQFSQYLGQFPLK